MTTSPMHDANGGAAVEFADYVEVLQYRARYNPDLQVYTFLEHGDGAEQTITCAELERRARQTAVALRARVDAGDRVLLLYPPGIDYIVGFFSCMIAGVIAVPAYPIEPAQIERTLPRLLGIISDCDAQAILTTAAAREQAMRFLSDSRSLAKLPWIATDEPSKGAGSLPAPDHALPVYLQYTSGSTGAPKGVMISHRNLLHNSALIARRFEHSAASRGVIWLPPYHDMGLIGGILQPLYVGFPVVLMSHIDFLKHPLRWLRTISKVRATTGGGPNFAYEMLASMRIADADFEKLDLRSWDVAFTGAEPVRAKTLHAFAQRFAPCGFRPEAFYPCYGLAEHTLFVTGGEKSRAPVIATMDVGAGSDAENAVVATLRDAMLDETKTVVGCGCPADDSRLLVVDPQTRKPCADGEVGELWAQGPSVAMGYWGKQRLTRQTFHARINDSSESFLRTGDYGYRLGTEFFITGRLKDMMVIRGANHYPQDIEATIEELDTDIFRPGGCAVFTMEESVAPHLVVVREVRARFIKSMIQHGDESAQVSGPSADELFSRVRSAISKRHGIAVSCVLFVPPAALPKTTSGKIQRYSCRASFVEGSLPIVARWSADQILFAGRAR